MNNAEWVPAMRTVLTFERAASALKWAIGSRLSSAVRDDILALALAQSALETGRWIQIWNYNFGNIRPRRDQLGGMYTCLPLCDEIINGKTHWYTQQGELMGHAGPLLAPAIPVPPGHPGSWFMAYPNEYDGADNYVAFIESGRYAPAWQRILDGDAEGFIRELKAAGYFTANQSDYMRTTVALRDEFLRKLRNIPHDETPVSPGLTEHARFMLTTWISEQSASNEDRGAAV